MWMNMCINIVKLCVFRYIYIYIYITYIYILMCVCVCLSVCLRLSLPMAKIQYITAVMKYIAHLKKREEQCNCCWVFCYQSAVLVLPPAMGQGLRGYCCIDSACTKVVTPSGQEKNMKSHMFLWAMGKCAEPLWSSSGWLQVVLLWWHGDRRYFSPIHHSMEQKIKQSQNWKLEYWICGCLVIEIICTEMCKSKIYDDDS